MAIRRLPRLSELPSEISADEFWALFGDTEYERLDFKESAGYLKDIIPAMAMTLGGIVICGISDLGRSLAVRWARRRWTRWPGQATRQAWTSRRTRLWSMGMS